MKKLTFLLVLALLLSLGASAWAEEGLELAVIDGQSVVVVTPDENVPPEIFNAPDFTVPSMLLTIEEEAFADSGAGNVKISENVGAIGPRAFADCLSLRAILIPPTVTSIDASALDGSPNAVVLGASGSEAESFALAAGAPFIPLRLDSRLDADVIQPPATLPFLSLN